MWHYYSISEAVSPGGYTWERGDGDGERLYYCGNDNGGTEIGTAVAM
jgi:hypothetical protein